jgi:hypothetical protein
MKQVGHPYLALSSALLLWLGPSPAARADFAPGRITLKSGEVMEGDVLKTVGEVIIVLTEKGLRTLPRGSVEKAEPGVEIARKPSKPPPEPGKKKKPPRQPASAGDAPREDDRPVEEAGAIEPTAPPGSKTQPDKRLDAARAGGPSPVLEISLGASVEGKVVSATDAFTISRLSFFFTEVSRPRFEVVGQKGKKAVGRPADYRAELAGDAAMKDITFYGQSILKTFRAKLLLRLVRVSDKKVVDELEVVEDVGGDPQSRDEHSRRVYNRAVEKLVRELKSLPTFGGQKPEERAP